MHIHIYTYSYTGTTMEPGAVMNISTYTYIIDTYIHN